MDTWIVETFGLGENLARGLSVGVSLLIVLILIALFISILKRLAGARLPSGRGRQPRIAVMDATSIDTRRRLLLVRRDNVEHLILVGGANDLVIEPGIIRGAPVAQPVNGTMGTPSLRGSAFAQPAAPAPLAASVTPPLGAAEATYAAPAPQRPFTAEADAAAPAPMTAPEPVSAPEAPAIEDEKPGLRKRIANLTARRPASAAAPQAQPTPLSAQASTPQTPPSQAAASQTSASQFSATSRLRERPSQAPAATPTRSATPDASVNARPTASERPATMGSNARAARAPDAPLRSAPAALREGAALSSTRTQPQTAPSAAADSAALNISASGETPAADPIAPVAAPAVAPVAPPVPEAPPAEPAPAASADTGKVAGWTRSLASTAERSTQNIADRTVRPATRISPPASGPAAKAMSLYQSTLAERSQTERKDATSREAPALSTARVEPALATPRSTAPVAEKPVASETPAETAMEPKAEAAPAQPEAATVVAVERAETVQVDVVIAEQKVAEPDPTVAPAAAPAPAPAVTAPVVTLASDTAPSEVTADGEQPAGDTVKSFASAVLAATAARSRRFEGRTPSPAAPTATQPAEDNPDALGLDLFEDESGSEAPALSVAPEDRPNPIENEMAKVLDELHGQKQ
ncbi:flagellar biosynthetic protein FliO [Roseibium aestuarii]|uniref:Flagellar biosynthetic protein FliO n=1 Tax=Roseibium aestuarii TaxID=2600299 RepID=A0ABW4JYT9_9HYPH|nr:flagellar biosynthetic protein FliO [Roseibium aestuarii]